MSYFLCSTPFSVKSPLCAKKMPFAILVAFVFLFLPIKVLGNGYRFLREAKFLVNNEVYSVAIVENEFDGGVAGFQHIRGEKDVVIVSPVDHIWWFFCDKLTNLGVQPGHDYFTNIRIKNIESHGTYVVIEVTCDWKSGKSVDYVIQFDGHRARILGADFQVAQTMEKTQQAIEIIAELIDGSNMKGCCLVEKVEFKTQLGKLELKPQEIEYMTHTEIKLKDGSLLKGTLQEPMVLKVNTTYGEFSIEQTKIKKVQFVSTKPQQKAEEGKELVSSASDATDIEIYVDASEDEPWPAALCLLMPHIIKHWSKLFKENEDLRRQLKELSGSGTDPIKLEDLGLIRWEITNKSKQIKKLKVSSKVLNWSNIAVDIINIPAGSTSVVTQMPIFQRDKLVKNSELAAATLHLTVQDLDSGSTIWEETRTIQLTAINDIVWRELNSGANLFLAAWVTPRDPVIEYVLSEAKEKLPERNFVGYQKGEEYVYEQMKAIFYTLRDMGLSYVNSPRSSVGECQRIRLPRESLQYGNMNCVDGAVLYASLFEAIGLDPVIVLGPGHALVGVYTEGIKQGSGHTAIMLETTLTGRGRDSESETELDDFDQAVNAASDIFSQWKSVGKIEVIPVSIARTLGIVPIR